MTNQHAQRSANPVAQYGKRDGAPMGRTATPDPLRDPRRIWYVDNVKDFENDETLWWSAVRGHAYNWLKDHNCVQSINRTEIVQGCQKLTSNRTLAGFREYMSNVERSLEALNEETAAVQQRPLLSHADMFEAAAKKYNTDPNLYLGARREALAAHGIGADQSLYQESYETFCAANSRPVVKNTSPFGGPLTAEVIDKSKREAARIAAEVESLKAQKESEAMTMQSIAEKDRERQAAEHWTKMPGAVSEYWEYVFIENAVLTDSERNDVRPLIIQRIGGTPAEWPERKEADEIARTVITEFRQAKIDAQKPTPKTPEKAPETHPAATPIPETPTTPILDAQKAVNPTDTFNASNPMAEAAFVVLFSLYGPHGAELKFTVRAMTVDELDTRIENLTQKFMSKGYKAERASAAMPAPVTQAIAPAPSSVAPASNGGSFLVSEVKKFQDEGKIEYHLFETGRDKPSLKIRVKGDLDKLAQHIDLSQMVVGQRYAVSMICEWVNSSNVGQNGKPFRNLKALLKPAA